MSETDSRGGPSVGLSVPESGSDRMEEMRASDAETYRDLLGIAAERNRELAEAGVVAPSIETRQRS